DRCVSNGNSVDGCMPSTERISGASNADQSKRSSLQPAISADGRFVAFGSRKVGRSRNDNSSIKIVIHDRITGTTEELTNGRNVSFQPSLSANGRYVAFESFAGDLVRGDANGFPDMFVHDRLTGVTELVSLASDGTQSDSGSHSSSISRDGRVVGLASPAGNLLPADTNGID